MNYQAVIDELKTTSYKKGDVLYSNGDVCNYIYYIVDGKVKTSLYTDDGKELITQIYVLQDQVGMVSILSGLHNEVAEVIEDSIIKRIPISFVKEILFSDNEAMEYFISNLCDYISDINLRLLHTAYKSIDVRLDRCIKEFGENGLKRRDMAAYIGIAYESLNRSIAAK